MGIFFWLQKQIGTDLFTKRPNDSDNRLCLELDGKL